MTEIYPLKNTNTILYCKKWQETVDFYQHRLRLPVNFASDWFVEFKLNETANLSIADECRATIKSCGGAGITITLQVESITEAWQYLHNNGLAIEPIREHPWGARVFYFLDPEGHRLEVWSLNKKK